MMDVSVFLPVRKGSRRIPGKNTRPFAGFPGGLLQLKLEQMASLEGIREVVVSSNDPKCLEVAAGFKESMPSLRLVERPDELARDQTDLTDLIRYAGKICRGGHILWTHVTSPCFDAEAYTDSLKRYREGLEQSRDSLVTGKPYKAYLLDKKFCLVNNPGPKDWPRTQDLKELFELDNAVFLASGELFRSGRRIGKHPQLMKTDPLRSLDVDLETDFKIAEAVYERYFK